MSTQRPGGHLASFVDNQGDPHHEREPDDAFRDYCKGKGWSAMGLSAQKLQPYSQALKSSSSSERFRRALKSGQDSASTVRVDVTCVSPTKRVDNGPAPTGDRPYGFGTAYREWSPQKQGQDRVVSVEIRSDWPQVLAGASVRGNSQALREWNDIKKSVRSQVPAECRGWTIRGENPSTGRPVEFHSNMGF